MALKDTLAKLNEIDFNEIDLNDIDFSSAGLWPAPVKALIGVAVFIGVLLLGYFFLVTDLQTDLDRVVREEGLLKTEFKEKYRQAVHLEAYRRQALEMEESFKQILSQLPSDTEIPGLIEDISKVGVSNGLVFNKIDLLPEQVLEYYIEKPIRIEVVGGYHSLGAFVSDVADLSRIVTLHDFQIKPQGGGRTEGGTLLTMEITAKTYRYKDGAGS
jgi:type IV pilus assembly protein PilO